MVNLRQLDEKHQKQHRAQSVENKRQAGQLTAVGIDRIIGEHRGQHAAERRHAHRVDQPIDQQLVDVIGERIRCIGQPRDEEAHHIDDASTHPIGPGAEQTDREQRDDFGPELQVTRNLPALLGRHADVHLQQVGLQRGGVGEDADADKGCPKIGRNMPRHDAGHQSDKPELPTFGGCGHRFLLGY